MRTFSWLLIAAIARKIKVFHKPSDRESLALVPSTMQNKLNEIASQ